MPFERVLQIWDYYDGVRSGVALVDGAPHYFECIWDNGADNYSDLFHLYPVSEEFMRKANQQWGIFRAWEAHFHRLPEPERRAAVKTHPGHGNINAEYDKLEFWLNRERKSLKALPRKYSPTFRALPNQKDRPPGTLPELEAAWAEA